VTRPNLRLLSAKDLKEKALTMREIDPLIKPYVESLNQIGIVTWESCQGGEGHCTNTPFIHFGGNLAEGHRALAHAMFCRWPVSELQRYWSVQDGEPHGPHWRLTFISTERLSHA
jgi:hypothetical protein